MVDQRSDFRLAPGDHSITIESGHQRLIDTGRLTATLDRLVEIADDDSGAGGRPEHVCELATELDVLVPPSTVAPRFQSAR